MNRIITQVPISAVKGSVLLGADFISWVVSGPGVPPRVIRETIETATDDQRVSVVETLARFSHQRQTITERLADAGKAAGVAVVGGAVVAVGLNAWGHVPYELTYGSYGAIGMAAATRRGWPAKTNRPITGNGIDGIPQGNELVWSALCAIGAAGEKLKGGTEPMITESWRGNEHGWSCTVELGSETTIAQVMAKFELLATTLRVHPSRLSVLTDDDRPNQIKLYAANSALRDLDTATWPLPDQGSYFDTFPLGRCADGSTFNFSLAHRSIVIGGLPRYGKSYTLRAMLTAVAQDPTVEVIAADLKGTGDLNSLAAAGSVVRGSGPNELERLLGLLQSVHAEIPKRADIIDADTGGLGDGSYQVTREQGEAGIGLHPIIVAIDECHILFRSEVGADALKIVEDLVRRGPAVGITVILATQSSKDNSIPADIADCADVKIAHRVAASKMETSLFGDSGDGTCRPQNLTDRDKGVAIIGIGGNRTAIKVFGCDAVKAQRLLEWRAETETVVREVVIAPEDKACEDTALVALLQFLKEQGRNAVPFSSLCQNLFGTTKPTAAERAGLEAQLKAAGATLTPKSSAICPITEQKKSGTIVRLP